MIDEWAVVLYVRSICILGLEGRGVGGDGGHCINSKLDELNVSGGVGSNSNGINGANNPNRKKKKKRRHRFDYVFQHQRTNAKANEQMVSTPSHIGRNI